VLLDLALATAPMRRIAERLYFHRRNDAGIDREAYLRWLERQAGADRTADSPIP
jgi:hypothetical protein